MKRLNDQVFVADERIVRVGANEVEHLKRAAGSNARLRARLCAHLNTNDPLHEMLIVLDRDTYVQPHSHGDKSESFHVIDGTLDVVVFTEHGEIQDVVEMGPIGSGRHFYYRLADPTFHTVVPRSPQVVIHETTNGPFDPHDTQFAQWAPAEGEREAVSLYLNELRQRIDRFVDRRPAA